MEIINWKELLYPYEQAVEELLLKFKNLDKECRHLGIYSPVDSVTGRLKTPASILDKAGRKHIAPRAYRGGNRGYRRHSHSLPIRGGYPKGG